MPEGEVSAGGYRMADAIKTGSAAIWNGPGGELYGFPVIDMKKAAERAGMDIKSHFEDKIHPNRAGYVMINRMISEEIGKRYGV